MKKLLILLAVISSMICVSATSASGSDRIQQEDSVHFYLLPGLTRESGHWGISFEDSVKEQFHHARITYLYPLISTHEFDGLHLRADAVCGTDKKAEQDGFTHLFRFGRGKQTIIEPS